MATTVRAGAGWTAEVRGPLRDGAPLILQTEACLTVRTPRFECRHCAAICPTHSLRLEDGALTLDDSCLGCGRCAAACPTGALAVEGFAPPEPAHLNGATVCVDCWKVPIPESGAALRLPCLGGLDAGRLLWLYLKSGERAVHLLDRGWCGDCPAGRGRRHPAAAAVAEACAWLAALGIPDAEQPRLDRRPLPRTAMRRDTPNAREELPIARRAFFRRLGGEFADALTDTTAAPHIPALTGRRPAAPSPARERLRLLLEIIAARRHRPVPSRFYPAVTIGADCRHHTLCAALCPTAALRVVNADGGAGIVFDANACIACGQCEHACPEQALELRPLGDGTRPTAPSVLTRRRLRECSDCGQTFAPAGDEEHCSACARSRDFTRTAFDALFRDSRRPEPIRDL